MNVNKITLCLFILVATLPVIQCQDGSPGPDILSGSLPRALVSRQGVIVDSPELWEKVGRPELLELFEDHVYGGVPEAPLKIDHRVRVLERDRLSGNATMKEVNIIVSNETDELSFTILILLPADAPGPVPLFLGLNFNGNHTIHANEKITITNSWVRNNSELNITDNKATIQSRGTGAKRWPVEFILSRGYGLATIYYGDIDPDFHDGFENGIHRLFPENDSERDPGVWGSIASWAWGLSRAMDYLESDPDVDPDRVAVMGHSRLGKTSLWAGATDERFSLVISNNSGCGGAALSMRAHGETVSKINTRFPHWFAGRFQTYNDNESALPVDQHMLLGLIAPRALYVASAKEDDWADPYGEYLSLFYGSRVYELFGNKVMDNDRLPGVDQPRWTGKLGYHIRTGKHDVTLFDWEQYIEFADLNMVSGKNP